MCVPCQLCQILRRIQITRRFREIDWQYMNFKVIYKETFLEDFERILKSIASRNPAAARKLGLSILPPAESLNSFPERNSLVVQRSGVRRFVGKKHFKVFYRVQMVLRTVEILRCWDGRCGTDPLIR